MENIICSVCGLEINGSGSQRTGRPKQFHKGCRELKNSFSLLQSRLSVFRAMNPTKEKRKAIRSSLWSLANGMN